MPQCIYNPQIKLLFVGEEYPLSQWAHLVPSNPYKSGYATAGVNLLNGAPHVQLTDGDYSCDKNITVDRDMFTYPYYWVNSHVCAVKILQPVTPNQNYFEFRITCPGEICAITIGVVGRDYPLDRQPGWVEEGIGYHADDGRLFHEIGYGKPFGPTCTTGDRMGCGIDFEGEDSLDYVKVFFTKNGQQVGDFVKYKKPKSGLYPLMGMNSRGEQIQYLGRWNHLPKGGTVDLMQYYYVLL